MQRIHGGLCSTYESASTRRFQSGRVDCIRASHPEALDWAKAMHTLENTKDTGVDLNANRKSLFMKAITKQTKVLFSIYSNSWRYYICFNIPVLIRSKEFLF